MSHITINREHAARGRFAWLMGVYGENYWRLVNLFSPDRLDCGRYVSSVGDGLDVQLDVIAKHPYTLELKLSYTFHDELTGQPDPSAHILCYRDARVAEVTACYVGSRLEDVLERFGEYNAPVRELIAATPPENLFKWGLFDRNVRERWSEGAVTLLGDAAHPMLPFLGQGAAMGIEDAMLLARAFDAAGSVDEALRRYVEARQSRTTWVMQQSRETARTYHSGRSENFQPGRHVSAESLGIMTYNPAAVPV